MPRHNWTFTIVLSTHWGLQLSSARPWQLLMLSKEGGLVEHSVFAMSRVHPLKPSYISESYGPNWLNRWTGDLEPHLAPAQARIRPCEERSDEKPHKDIVISNYGFGTNLEPHYQGECHRG